MAVIGPQQPSQPPALFQQDPRQRMIANLLQNPRQPQQQLPPIPSGLFTNALGGSGGSSAALGAESVGADAAAGSGGGLGGLGPAAGFAALIGSGKLIENDRLRNDPDDPFGNALLSGLGPSLNQVTHDPLRGLAALGAGPFSSFVLSDEAKQQKPEWAGLLGF